MAKVLVETEPRLRVIELRRNFGQTAALQAGLAAAEGDLVVSLDADLQHFPEDLPLFLEKIEEGHDLVCGWRHASDERDRRRRWPSRIANSLIGRSRDSTSTTSAPPSARIDPTWCMSCSYSANSQFRSGPGLPVGVAGPEIKIQHHRTTVGGRGATVWAGPSRFFSTSSFCISLLLYMERSKGVRQDRAGLWPRSARRSPPPSSSRCSSGVPDRERPQRWFLLSALLMLAGLQTLPDRDPGRDSRARRPTACGTARGTVRREWRRSMPPLVMCGILWSSSPIHGNLPGTTASLSSPVNPLRTRPDDGTCWPDGWFIPRASAAGDHRPRHRPAADGDRGRPRVILNGEIYNYRRAARGARAPAVIASARRPTPKCCCTATGLGSASCSARLDGMFAFAICDRARATALPGARPLRREAAASSRKRPPVSLRLPPSSRCSPRFRRLRPAA